ncbi:MAG: hypothetical protein AAFV53_08595 [Myxococcota bacterium]
MSSLADEARELAREGRWEEAAEHYETLASVTDRPEIRLQALIFAGDAWRRADRPARSARQLREAMPLAQGGPMDAALHLQLADVLLSSGQVKVARDLAVQALQKATTPGVEALALDTLIGVLTALGRFDECEIYLERLRAVAPPPARVAVSFRSASRLRRVGDLDGADQIYADLVDTLQQRRETIGAAAAAATDRGEVALFRGDPAAARLAYQQAAELWTVARRRAGLYRCEAGLLRAELLDDATPLPRVLDDLIRFAEQRQMVLLDAHLRVVRGAARARVGLRGAEEDLDSAVLIAQLADCPILEGRARLVRQRSGLPGEDAAQIRLCLQGDHCWTAAADGRGPLPW